MTSARIDRAPMETLQDTPAALHAASFARVYDDYRFERRTLHDLEIAGSDANVQFRTVITYKEALAGAAARLFEASDDIDVFSRHLASALQTSEQRRYDRFTDPRAVIMGAYIMPLSLRCAQPSPVESIVTTAENKTVAQEFAEVGRETLTGLVMSGTTAWGAFYATRGPHPELHKDYLNERSDVDLVAIAEDIHAIEETLRNYISSGMVGEEEMLRFEEFKTLHRKGKVDIFSMRTWHKGIQQSIHFLTYDVMEAITTVQPIQTRKQDGHKVSYVRDFRPNKPTNPGRTNGGYTISDLRGFQVAIFKPNATPLQESDGYISETPVGSIFTINGEQTYSLGLIDYLLVICPDIMFDTEDRQVETWIQSLQNTIAGVQGKHKVVNVPRMLRMPKQTLRRIQGSLSLQ